MKKTVAVLYGGRSGEHEVSIRSAESVINALDASKYEIRRIFITKEGRWEPGPLSPEPGANPGIDVVFPVLHGTFGEDGTVQGLLELAGLPYVGAGVLASSLAMDKEAAKRVMIQAAIPVVEYYLASGPHAATENPFGYPVFVKPANLGSSVGVSKAKSQDELRQAICSAAQYDTKVLVERAIVGTELECSVLGNESPEASQPCEILPSRDFYDYEDKYILDRSEFRMPAALPDATIEQLRGIAVRAYRALGCEGMSRVDFLLENSTGTLFVNEVNTIPGFTSISMYPRMWEHSGLPYGRLLDRLIELAISRHERRQSLKYTR
ncbi:MAG TPA: D-alanine--D-alanine ligase family protein [Bryobacteraceae bacterium]|nr:D-alanine--D-alanine ligase family protein [Bryobacteraceae bacterium]